MLYVKNFAIDHFLSKVTQVLLKDRARSIQPNFPEISVQNSMDRFGPTGKVSEKRVHLLRWSSFPGRTGWNFGWMDRAYSLFYLSENNENTLFATLCCLWSPRKFELLNGSSFYNFLLVQKLHVTLVNQIAHVLKSLGSLGNNKHGG